MTYPDFDFSTPADPDLYNDVMNASYAMHDGLLDPATYGALLAQYHAAEGARRERALSFIAV